MLAGGRVGMRLRLAALGVVAKGFGLARLLRSSLRVVALG
jgi:hypothetical protein